VVHGSKAFLASDIIAETAPNEMFPTAFAHHGIAFAARPCVAREYALATIATANLGTGETR